MADTVRYNNTLSTAGGNGTTNEITGANRAYATRSEAETAEQRVIDAGDRVIINCDGSTVDASGNDINGWTVNGELIFQGLEGARHSGFWDTDVYRNEIAGAFGYVYENNVKFRWLQIGKSASTAGLQALISPAGITGLEVSFCILKQSGSVTYTEPIFLIGEAGTSLTAFRNIMYGIGTVVSANNSHFRFTVSGLTATIYNNTMIGGNNAIAVPAGTSYITARNNIFSGQAAVPCTQTLALATHNTTNQASTGSGGSDEQVNKTFTFDGTTYLLASTDTGAINFGTDLSATIGSIDILGQTVTGTWDCGSHEYVAAGGGEVFHEHVFTVIEGGMKPQTAAGMGGILTGAMRKAA